VCSFCPSPRNPTQMRRNAHPHHSFWGRVREGKQLELEKGGEHEKEGNGGEGKKRKEQEKGKEHEKGGNKETGKHGKEKCHESRESKDIESRTWTRTKQYKRNRTGARIRRRKGIKPKAIKAKTKKKKRQGEVNLR
jgi:hypothetical protein